MFLGALVAVWLCAAGAPERAEAFLGESLVVNPATEDLTEAAKTIIEKPTFLAENVGEEALAYGGSEEAGSALGIFEGAGVLPVLGSVAAFGVGAGVGSYICNEVLSLEGCWFYGSEAAETKNLPELSWYLVKAQKATPLGGVIWPYEYIFGSNSNGGLFTPEGEPCPASPVANGVTRFVPGEVVKNACKVEGVGKSVDGQYYVRSSATNRGFRAATDAEAAGGTIYGGSGYCPMSGAAVGGCSSKPPADWSEGVVSALGNSSLAPSGVAERVGQAIGHAVSPTSVPDPYANITVPSCEGETSVGCVKTLEELGLAVEEKYLDWQTAVLPEPVDLHDPIESLEEAAQRVQKLEPKAGTAVVEGSKVVVTANPGLEDLPIVVPDDPAPGESPDQWIERRVAPMAPGVSAVPVPLGEFATDPKYDPETVVRPAPEPGTRLDPATTTEIKVRTNPAGAPPAVSGGGATCETSVGAIDWSPLNHSLGSKFPFGVFAFFVTWIGEWEAGEGVPPDWSVTFLPAGVFGSKGLVAHINLAFMAPVVGTVRTIFLFASFVGLLWFLGTAAAKVQGDGS